MTKILAGFGMLVICMSLLGSLGVGEFKLCYGPKGYCSKCAAQEKT